MASKKITVRAPNKKELTDAAKELRKGHPSAGRIMSEGAKAARQKKKR